MKRYFVSYLVFDANNLIGSGFSDISLTSIPDGSTIKKLQEMILLDIKDKYRYATYVSIISWQRFEE